MPSTPLPLPLPRAPALGLALALALTFAAAALPDQVWADTRTFRQAVAKDFEEGEVTGASILPSGEVVPGLVATRVGADAAFVWCGVASRDGSTAYFGTGDEGKIFAVSTRGEATGARRIAALDAPWVTALAVRADGALLAGSTPGGRIFTVEPVTGTVRTLGNVGAGHVWALARDDRVGITYVGTGAPGKIFAVDDRGGAREVWDSGSKHVVSLLRDTDGTLLAGTSEDAILYRVRVTDGRATAVQDFEAEEVRAIVRAPSGLFVAVNQFEKASSPSPAPSPAPGPTVAKGTKIVLGSGGPPASAGALPRPGARKAKSAVYRIEADGRIEQVMALGDGYLTALAVADDGAVYAAAGTQGHVFRVTPERTSSLMIDLPERQALTLVRPPGSTAILVGTGDVGGVYRATPAAGRGGDYLSKVLDAEFPARWGALRWLGTEVSFESRSGNTAKPDPGWSRWTPLDRLASIPGPGGSGHVASPAARYLQYRAVLSGAASRLLDVTTSYLPQNQRARVTELNVAESAGSPVASSTSGLAGGLSSGSGSGSGSAARPTHSPILRLRWKTENPDGDEVVYRLSFRQVGESVWRPLISVGVGVGVDLLTKPEYDWNTEGIPDGLYVVRVTVSDERSHPRERALVSAFESLPLLVDNGRPQIDDLGARYPIVLGRARDEASAIARIEFAVDGGEYQLVSPTDGIADDLSEAFSIRLPPLSRGPHAVAIRITDLGDNVGSSQITVKVP